MRDDKNLGLACTGDRFTERDWVPHHRLYEYQVFSKLFLKAGRYPFRFYGVV